MKILATGAAISLVFFALAAGADTGVKTPNHFTLSGGHHHITYSMSGIDGKPHFSYKDSKRTLSFSGDQITTVDTPLGKVVSVSIVRTIDTGSTSFSIFIPRVNLSGTAPAQLTTYGITTIHRFSIVPAMNKGQLDTYSHVDLTGTGSFVVF